ncbi:response regulator [Texcoconibacillus texcoconensis]|uniref:Two-component system response regulator YesN n=1 Tax=Texcoconibacillus texcoconensis TaxID=1095777 RepID=A0A840QRA9_9BACI|nr:response regulator [Texcoconibacillus texcoconensis]MBB5173889.1 two-component system response regulator YesN [Texcoconibacillus texcoconensis]
MKVLLVEDEIITRRGFRKALESQSDIQVIGECSNGKQALEQLKENPDIDVIFLDLNMPVMDGIEFLDHVEGMGFQGEIIVLSSYDDWEKVKESMKRGACDYFHKPTLSPQKIVDLVRKTADKRQQQNKGDGEEWLKKIISNPSEDHLQNSFHWLTKKEQHFLTVLIKIHAKDSNLPSIHQVKQEISSSNKTLSECITWLKDELILVQKIESKSQLENYETVINLCNDLSHQLKTSFGYTASYGISSIQSSSLKLRKCVEESQKALERLFFSNQGTVHFYNKQLENKDNEATNWVSEEHLWDAFLTFDAKKVEESLSTLFEQMAQEKDKETIVAQTINIILQLQRELEKRNITWVYLSTTKIIQAEHIQEVKSYVYHIFYQSIEEINKFQDEKYSPIIRQVLKYIEDHFAEDISLNELAVYVQANPSYLSRSFKQQSGYKISEYITKVRIEKAKSLLTDEKLKTQEVARRVGYTNERYFSQIFKKLTSLTPSEFKKQK